MVDVGELRNGWKLDILIEGRSHTHGRENPRISYTNVRNSDDEIVVEYMNGVVYFEFLDSEHGPSIHFIDCTDGLRYSEDSVGSVFNRNALGCFQSLVDNIEIHVDSNEKIIRVSKSL